MASVGEAFVNMNSTRFGWFVASPSGVLRPYMAPRPWSLDLELVRGKSTIFCRAIACVERRLQFSSVSVALAQV